MTMLKSFKSKSNGNNGIEKVSRQHVIDLLETRSRKRLGISAKQMLKKYRTGKLESVGEVADLLVIADMLPPNDPIFG